MLVHLPLPDGTLTQLNVTVWGEENAARTLLCVHGLTRNSRDFDVLAKAAVVRGFRVVCPDMPGRGKSARLTNPAFYNNLINTQLTLALLVKMGVSKVDWLGTSMGGIMAIMAANQAPSLIHKLVLNDVGCVIPAKALQRIGEYVGDSPVHQSYLDAQEALKLRTVPFGVPAEYWQEFSGHSIEQVEGGFRLAYDPAIAAAFVPDALQQDILLWPLWEAVKLIPTMLIRGVQSDLLDAQTASQMQANHPQLTYYEVPNAGHAPALMSEVEIKRVIDFLD